MRQIWSLLVIAFALMLSATGVFCMDLDWTMKEELKLEASPLDVATSSDGQWLFILVPERVLVYSASEKSMLKEIQVEQGYDRLSYSPQDNGLVLSSSSARRLAFVSIESVHAFDLSDLPVKGPEDAPVTIVVFSDYQ